MKWSEKQLKLVNMFENDLAYHFAIGAVRSGKTFAAAAGIIQFMETNYHNELAILAGPNDTMLDANLIQKAVKPIAQSMGLRVTKEDRKRLVIGNNTYLKQSAGLAGSKDAIQGGTIRAALIDEVMLCHKDFISEMDARCILGKTKIIHLGNPETKRHPWVKKYWNRYQELRGEQLHFVMTDNPIMTKEERSIAEQLWTGYEKRRKFDGIFASPSGAVFGDIEETPLPDANLYHVQNYDLAIDHAHIGTTAAILLADYGDIGTWAIDEWRHNGREEQPDDDAIKQAKRIEKELVKDKNLRWVVVDEAALNMAYALEQIWPGKVIRAKGKVMDTINMLGTWMENNWIHFSPKCDMVMEDLENYLWDERKDALGESAPLKTPRGEDHFVDAMRYYVHARANLVRRPLKIIERWVA